jgi:hypothetical protein
MCKSFSYRKDHKEIEWKSLCPLCFVVHFCFLQQSQRSYTDDLNHDLFTLYICQPALEEHQHNTGKRDERSKDAVERWDLVEEKDT